MSYRKDLNMLNDPYNLPGWKNNQNILKKEVQILERILKLHKLIGYRMTFNHNFQWINNFQWNMFLSLGYFIKYFFNLLWKEIHYEKEILYNIISSDLNLLNYHNKLDLNYARLNLQFTVLYYVYSHNPWKKSWF